MTSNLDWFFTTIAAISFLAHLALVIYLRSVDWPRKPDIDDDPRSLRADGGEAAARAAAHAGAGGRPRRRRKRAPKKEEKKAPPAKRELTEEEKARPGRGARARRRPSAGPGWPRRCKNTGILKVLGAKADGEGSIADVLGKGDVDRDQEKAFQGVGGLTVATGDAAAARGEDRHRRRRPGGQHRRPARQRRASPAAAPAASAPNGGSPAS